MAAQSGMQADLFIYDIASGFVTRLTDDSYMEMQPRFSPDGRMLAYSAERQTIGEADGYFAAMTTDIYTIEIDSRSQLQRTFDDAKCSKPFWDKSGKRVIYLSDQGGVSNLQVLDLESGSRAAVAPTLCGIYSADISSDEENMVLSVYFKGAWNIYLGDNPLPELQYQDYLAAQPVTDRPDLLESVNLGLLDNYGKRPRVLIPREHGPKYDISVLSLESSTTLKRCTNQPRSTMNGIKSRIRSALASLRSKLTSQSFTSIASGAGWLIPRQSVLSVIWSSGSAT